MRSGNHQLCLIINLSLAEAPWKVPEARRTLARGKGAQRLPPREPIAQKSPLILRRSRPRGCARNSPSFASDFRCAFRKLGCWKPRTSFFGHRKPSDRLSEMISNQLCRTGISLSTKQAGSHSQSSETAKHFYAFYASAFEQERVSREISQDNHALAFRPNRPTLVI